MALIIETHLVCDRCGNTTFGKDKRERTGSQQRALAQNSGWGKHSSFDICPDCKFKNGRGNKGVLINNKKM